MPQNKHRHQQIAARAASLLDQGYHCSEAIVLAVGEHLQGRLEPQAARMATGLGGGLGGTRQEMCGALSGGVLVIGALHGRHRLPASDEPAYSLAARLREQFLAELGATQCEQIRAGVEAPGGPGSCAPVVEKATLLLLGLLDSTGKKA